MKFKQYQVDAFTDKAFGGNPAAVVPLSCWLEDGLLQAIAEENNLSATAFFVAAEPGYQLRWFTPTQEVDLCGHATLAAAQVIFEHLGETRPAISFATRSGELRVERKGRLLEMNFPSCPPKPCALPPILVQALGQSPIEVVAASDYLVLFDTEASVRSLVPDQGLLAQLELRGVIVTAPGTDSDFVSRFFAPKFGIPEDPVTGSAHCALVPYWAGRLGKNRLDARQLSKRGGCIVGELQADRVLLSGMAVTVIEAEMRL